MKSSASDKAKKFVDKGMRNHTQQDADMWEIISDVPYTSGVFPYFLFVLNVISPGMGTMISACFAYDGAWSKT